MKLKNFAIITEDKVTEIFCIAYDFCKVFDTQMAKYSLWQNESANITVKAAYKGAEEMATSSVC